MRSGCGPSARSARRRTGSAWRCSLPWWRLEVIFSFLAKQFNAWNNNFYNALQEKNYDDFIYFMKVFTVLAFFHILISVYKNYINQVLQIRWRKSMTDFFVERWLTPGQHYRMRMLTGPADNPDQRDRRGRA